MVMAVFWVLIVEGIIGAMGMFLAQSTSIGYRRQTDHRGCQSGSQLAAPGFQEHRLLRLLLAGSTVDHQEFCWQTDQWLNQPAVVQLVVPDHTYLDCLAADPAAGSDHSCLGIGRIAGSGHSCFVGPDRSHPGIDPAAAPAYPIDPGCPGFADNRSSSDDFLFFLVLQMHISLKMSTCYR